MFLLLRYWLFSGHFSEIQPEIEVKIKSGLSGIEQEARLCYLSRVQMVSKVFVIDTNYCIPDEVGFVEQNLFSLSGEAVQPRLILFSERLQYPAKREPQVNYYLMDPVNQCYFSFVSVNIRSNVLPSMRNYLKEM